eukprot:gb/GFBE01075808.1/.p1 GENE.gb/GFBE01075808.1/~~gb/GFBE01075808.1/.p1  ORF type:complete len:314 (+),score=47.52 gb/GFBE01075808.1/:1-942(+)
MQIFQSTWLLAWALFWAPQEAAADDPEPAVRVKGDAISNTGTSSIQVSNHLGPLYATTTLPSGKEGKVFKEYSYGGQRWVLQVNHHADLKRFAADGFSASVWLKQGSIKCTTDSACVTDVVRPYTGWEKSGAFQLKKKPSDELWSLVYSGARDANQDDPVVPDIDMTQWKHFAVIFNAAKKEWKVYVNADYKASFTVPESPVYRQQRSNAAFRFTPDGTENFMVYDVRMYFEQLSLAQVYNVARSEAPNMIAAHNYCTGSLVEEIWGCDGSSLQDCSNLYTAGGGGVFVQCGVSSQNCIALGPFCEAMPMMKQ